MEILIQIFKQLPPFWPRVALLAVLVLLLSLPRARNLLLRGGTGSRRLDRAKKLLELRKLEIEVAALRAQHPGGSILDPQIAKLLGKPAAGDEDEDEGRPLPWRERIRLAGLGAGSFLVISLLALGLSGRRSGSELLQLGLWELVFLVPCALLASAIPANARWAALFHGVLVPMIVAALAVAARV